MSWDLETGSSLPSSTSFIITLVGFSVFNRLKLVPMVPSVGKVAGR
jgi:hypothetical protein